MSDSGEQIKAMQQMTAAMREMTQALEKNEGLMSSLGDKSKELADIDLSSMSNQHKTASDAAGEQNDEVEKSITLYQKLLEVGKKTLESLARIGEATLKGLEQGFRNFEAIVISATGVVSKMGDAFLSVGVSLVSIPFKIFDGFVEMANKAAGGSTELAQAIENLRKQFGKLSGPGPKTIMTLATTMKGFKDTGLGAFQVFGNLAKRIEDFNKLAVGMGATFYSFTKELSDNGGAVLAYQKGLGFAEEDMKTIATTGLTMGKSLTDVLEPIRQQAQDLGDAFNIDSKIISRQMVKAMQDVGHFSSLTAKQLGSATVYANKLGVELEKVTGLLDAFETFDTAAENVAKLSQSFGMNINAFELMKEQDPSKMMDSLRKSFFAAGQDASKFDRQQLKLLTSVTGMDAATTKLMFSQKNQGASLDDIKKKSESAGKKQLTQAEAMKKLADNIERLVNSGATGSGGFFDRFIKGIMGGIQASGPFMKMIFNIKQGLNLAEMAGVKLGRAFVDSFPGVKKTFDSISEFFKAADAGKFFNNLASNISKYFSKGKDKLSFKSVMDNIKSDFTNMFSMKGETLKKILESIDEFFEGVFNFFEDALDWVGNQLEGDLFDKATGSIGDFFSAIFSEKMLTRVWNMISKISGLVWKGLKLLFEKAWNIVSNFKLSTFLDNIFGPGAAGRVKDYIKNLGKKIIDSIPMIKDYILKGIEKLLYWLQDNVFNKNMFKKATSDVDKGIFDVLGETFGKVFEELKKMGEQIWPVLLEALEELGKSMYEFFTSKEFLKFIKPILPVLLGVLFGPAAQAAVSQTLSELFGKDMSGVVKTATHVIMVSKQISTAMDKYGNTLIKKYGQVQGKASVAAIGLANTLTFGMLPEDMAQKIGDYVGKNYNEIMTSIKSVFPKFGPEFEKTFSRLFDFSTKIGDFVNKLLDFDNENYKENLLESGLTLINGAADGIAAGLKLLLNDFPRMIDDLLQGFLNILDAKQLSASEQAAKDLADEQSGPGGKLKVAFRKMFENLADRLPEIIGQFFTIMKDIAIKLAKIGAKLMWRGIKNAIMGGEEKPAEPPPAAGQLGQNIGEAIGKGAQEGLNSQPRLGETMKEQVQEDLDMHSPSRVAMGWGKNIADGLGKGLESAPEQVKSAFADMQKEAKEGANSISKQTQAAVGSVRGGNFQKPDPSVPVSLAQAMETANKIAQQAEKFKNEKITGGVFDEVQQKINEIFNSESMQKLFGSLNNIIDRISEFKTSKDKIKAFDEANSAISKFFDAFSTLNKVLLNLSKKEDAKTKIDFKVIDDKLRELMAAFKGFSELLPTLTTEFSGAMERINDPIKKMTESSKKLVGGLDAVVPMLSRSLGSIDGILKVFTALKTTVQGFHSVVIDSFSLLGEGVQTLNSTSMKIADDIKKGGLTQNLKAITEMVDKVNLLHSTLGKLPNIKLTAKLKTLADGLGMGGKFNYQIRNNDVVVNIDMTVTMNAADMEKALILRAKSIVRDRLNFATHRPTDKTVSPKLPETTKGYAFQPIAGQGDPQPAAKQ